MLMNSGAPKCWWCRTSLSRSRHGGYVYAESRDRDGNKVKVHKTCKEPADADSKPITAQPTPGSMP